MLLVQRAHDPGAGRWSLPGGRVERGETLAGAVLRELREETGLHGTVGALCGVAERITRDHHYVILDFWVTGQERRPVPGEPVAGGDATAVGWAGATDLAQFDLVRGLRDFLDRHGVTAQLR